jgi:hypothetical protein
MSIVAMEVEETEVEETEIEETERTEETENNTEERRNRGSVTLLLCVDFRSLGRLRSPSQPTVV